MPPRTAKRNRFDENVLSFLDKTAQVAFASDEKHRIVAWNQAAVRLFGADAAQVAGKPCHEVIRGTDLFGNRFCSESCPLRKMGRRHEPIHAFQFRVQTASKATLKVECNIVVVPGPRPGGHSLIHLLLPATRAFESENIERTCPDLAPSNTDSDPDPKKEPPSGCVRPLTPRESQILGLVAAGADTGQIAGLLSISVVTVRNHVQHILNKLEVHNKLQAILVARHHKMI